MEDIQGIEAKGNSSDLSSGVHKRRKPGPKKRAETRTEKESCRLTKEEKALRRAYCKQHGIKPADLLRAAYLAATFSEGERFKVVFDAATMLRELKMDAEEMQDEFTAKGDAHSATRMASVSFKIASILRRLMIGIAALMPVAISSLALFSMLGTSVDAAHDPALTHRYKGAWLTGFLIGAAIDLALLPFVLPYQRKLDRWIAKRLWKLLGGPQKQRRYAEERRRYFEQIHLASRNSSR
ncbi:MAG: hypothetical protein KGI37_10840 [Alphaproteobacteria bacterium]|nr:hypothetical protein [Alphaproteobacteria bacterium]